MSLKITFESDIKGFERVQRALEEQQKILNQSAEAYERLSKAQAGQVSQAMDIKGMESLRATQDQIKNLTGSLDKLLEKRSGLSGFLGMFSEFGSEIKKLNTEASADIFKSMTGQIDNLRTSMKGTSEIMKVLRTEIDEAKAAGKSDEAAAKTEQLNELSTKQMTEGDLLSKLQRSKMWRQQILGSGDVPGGTGGLDGFLTGGTSLQRLSGIFAPIIGAMKGIEIGRKKTLQWREGADRGQEAAFNWETNIARSASQGSIGRQMRLMAGVGEEANLMRGGYTTDADGNFNLNKTLRTGKMFFSKMFSPTKDQTQILAEEANNAAALEQRKTFGVDMAAAFEKNLALNPAMVMNEIQHGWAGSRNFLAAFANNQITAQEAIPLMRLMSNLGFNQETLGQQGMGKVLGMMGRSPEELLMSQSGRAEFFRHFQLNMQKGMDPEQAMGSYLTNLSKFRGAMGGTDTPSEVMMGMTDYIQNIQSNVFGTQETMMGLSQPMRQAFALTAGDSSITAQDRASIAMASQNQLTSSVGRAGGAMSMAIDNSLIALGIKDSVQRGYIQTLISENRGDTAAQLISRLTGKSVDEVKSTLNQSVDDVYKLQDQVAGVDEKTEAIFAEMGLASPTQYMLSGTTLGPMGSAAGGRARKVGLFTDEEGGEMPTPGTTEGRKILGAQADQERTLLEANKMLTEALGYEIKNVLGEQISQGFLEMGNKIRESLTQLPGESKVNQRQVSESQVRSKPFEGVRDNEERKASDAWGEFK